MAKPAKAAASSAERALRIVENSSRVRLQDLRDNIGARTLGKQQSNVHNQHGHTIGQLQHAAKPPLGWIWGDFFRPWQRMFPGTKLFNADINIRREYTPLSLIELARLIDLGWVDQKKPIDIVALCATRKFKIEPHLRQCGFDLTPEGADAWKYPVDIEVQWASQRTIAAVESAGGRIRTAYYDPESLRAAIDAKTWFQSGRPVPRRLAPPPSLVSYYSDPVNRGYLADVAEIEHARQRLSMTMGTTLPETTFDAVKHPKQVFNGLPPGAIVSLKDRKVFMPTHPDVRDYYEEGLRADKQYP
ncbi:unnamed protein product, partial [Mesorhabditis belari]|uniref:Large ribosomal subunit protein uL15m n=1 Tax=Mesorhabditis belari TaxID=2138241 RepID=A0AAF3F4B2_9BILA